MAKGPPKNEDSLGGNYPELCQEIDQTKNTFDTMLLWPKSNKKIWWKCNNGPDHTWEAPISRRTGGSGCPFCSIPPRRVSITNCLETLYPDVSIYWDYEKNAKTPLEVFSRSNQKYWWKCDVASDHVYESPVDRVVRSFSETGNIACPFCAGFHPSITNRLDIHFPEIAKQLHTSKNGAITNDILSSGSTKKVWWQCKISPDHEWSQSPGVRTEQNVGCPFCAGQRVSSTNSLSSLFPELAEQWHPTKNGVRNPSDFASRSGEKAWWKCPVADDHEWEAFIYTRAGGHGCPYCANRKGSGSNNAVSYTNRLSLIFPKIAEEWHPTLNGNLSPDDFVHGSHTKVWWQCRSNQEHVWKTKIFKRTGQGTGCPSCAKYGIDVNAPTMFYTMRIENLADIWWWKAGISVDPARRATQIQNSLHASGIFFDVLVHEQIEFKTGQLAINFERKLLDEEKIRVSVAEVFSGSSELFRVNPLNHARENAILDSDDITAN